MDARLIHYSAKTKADPRERRGGDRPPPLDGCWPKKSRRQANKKRFYQSQNAPKLVFLSSKIKTFSGKGHSLLPRPLPGGEGTTLSIPHTLDAWILALTVLDSIAPLALDLGAYAGASIRPPPPATPSASAPAQKAYNSIALGIAVMRNKNAGTIQRRQRMHLHTHA